MKKILLIALTVTMATAAKAQQTSTQPAATPANGSSSTTTSNQPTASSSKYGAAFASQNTMGLKDANEFGAAAGIVSADTIAFSYKIAEKSKISVQHNFLYLTHINNNADGGALQSKGYREGYNLMDPAIAYGTQVGSVLGTDPVNLGARVYLPLSDASKNANRIAVLRSDAELNWTLNPKWSAMYVASPRFSMTNGAESAFRLIHVGGLAYNTTDNSAVYFNGGFDTTWTRLWNAATAAETVELELGANFQIGKIALNPALTNSIPTKGGLMALGRTEEMGYSFTATAGF